MQIIRRQNALIKRPGEGRLLFSSAAMGPEAGIADPVTGEAWRVIVTSGWDRGMVRPETPVRGGQVGS